MIVRPRNEANAGSDFFSVRKSTFFFNFLFIPSIKQDGNAIKGVRVETILFHSIEYVEVDAEESFPLKNGETIKKTFAESYSCCLKHRGILTEHLS